MCGIAGILEHNRSASPDSIQPLLDAIAHRGPDGQGFFCAGPVVMGHRRLAIVDRSEAAAQPYLSRDKRYGIVFNGEIYNVNKLRSHLLAHNVVFRSAGDTEVLLEWLIFRGIDGVLDLDGMFAFALWDNSTQTLWCCRDPLGIKPLFYWHGDHRFVFASEIDALQLAPGLLREPDWVALHQYFALNYVLAPRTGIAAIRQLLPGHWLKITSGGTLFQQSYYRPRFHPVQMARRDAAPALLAALRQSVANQLQSDVPIALWLSGGVDSAGLGAMWRELRSDPIVAYSAGFDDDGFDETARAVETASALNLELRRVIVKPQDVIRWMDDVSHWSEPTADSSSIAVAALARETARSHKVVLSGEGADELLGGYITYRAIHLAALWRRIPAAVRTVLSNSVLAALPVRYGKVGWDEQLRRFFSVDSETLPETFGRWREILSADVLAMLTAGTPQGAEMMATESPWKQWIEPFESQPEILHGAMFSDLLLYLPNDLLVKVDRASMRYGIEARVPYLGREMVDFCLSLPGYLHAPLGLGRKMLLRQALKQKVPRNVLWGKKRGFNVPLSRWFRGPLKDWLIAELGDDRVSSSPLLCSGAIMRLVREHLDGRADHGYALFGISLFLRWWHRMF
ncbi:MAG: asparagine synthase (glutamine-hydrolyzing) [Myxococcales bacterium]|nr:asparagine synthase (glutamine-hydrolyzing) [Myxococcales bacterium]